MIQKELAWCKLIPIDGFKLPHLLHQLVRTEGVHETERSWKQQGIVRNINVGIRTCKVDFKDNVPGLFSFIFC